MCYYLYGSINKEVNREDYENVLKKGYSFHFNIGSRHDVKMSVLNCESDYMISDSVCDCETAVGRKDPNNPELKELKDLLLDLRSVRDVQCVYLSKNWTGKINKKEKTVRIDDIDILEFLANVEDNCLYKIEMIRKY